jgi:hypothetical protein
MIIPEDALAILTVRPVPKDSYPFALSGLSPRMCAQNAGRIRILTLEPLTLDNHAIA